jgi:hypothetical protein
VVSNEDVDPPEDSLPDPQDTIANVQSDPPCIDSAPTEHSEPQAEQAHGRQRAMAQVRPINIADAVGGIAGSNPMGAVRNFDRIYFPDKDTLVGNSIVDGGPVDMNREELKRRADQISRSYSETFALLTSINSSNVEAAKFLNLVTNVCFNDSKTIFDYHQFFLFIGIIICIICNICRWQLKFTPADIPHTSLRTMAKNVRRAMLPESDIYKIELAEGGPLASLFLM